MDLAGPAGTIVVVIFVGTSVFSTKTVVLNGSCFFVQLNTIRYWPGFSNSDKEYVQFFTFSGNWTEIFFSGSLYK